MMRCTYGGNTQVFPCPGHYVIRINIPLRDVKKCLVSAPYHLTRLTISHTTTTTVTTTTTTVLCKKYLRLKRIDAVLL